jgi:predicted  nucleic acid-binding Zn-ribbon protein
MFKCLECGRKFRTTKAAYRASLHGCPGCGGVDVDLDTDPTPSLRAKVVARKVPAPQPNDGYHGEEHDPLRPEAVGGLPAGYHKEAGYVIGPNGRAVCPGVVCRCDEGVTTCPMHGKR